MCKLKMDQSYSAFKFLSSAVTYPEACVILTKTLCDEGHTQTVSVKRQVDGNLWAGLSNSAFQATKTKPLLLSTLPR